MTEKREREPHLQEEAGALAGDAALVERLRAEHVDNGRGYCRICYLQHTGPVPWPCGPAALAAAAARLLDQRARRRSP